LEDPRHKEGQAMSKEVKGKVAEIKGDDWRKNG
jgi:hypothetical protein